MIKRLLLKLISLYQGLLNFKNKHIHLSDSACRFRPTCSQYCYQAIEHHGILKGSLRCVKRIARCHPFSKGGWDPVK